MLLAPAAAAVVETTLNDHGRWDIHAYKETEGVSRYAQWMVKRKEGRKGREGKRGGGGERRRAHLLLQEEEGRLLQQGNLLSLPLKRIVDF